VKLYGLKNVPNPRRVPTSCLPLSAGEGGAQRRMGAGRRNGDAHDPLPALRATFPRRRGKADGGSGEAQRAVLVDL